MCRLAGYVAMDYTWQNIIKYPGCLDDWEVACPLGWGVAHSLVDKGAPQIDFPKGQIANDEIPA